MPEEDGYYIESNGKKYYSDDHDDKCDRVQEDTGFICTRPRGHEGSHVARGGGSELCAVWEDINI